MDLRPFTSRAVAFLRRHVDLLAVGIFGMVVHFRWFTHSGIFVAGDLTYHFPETILTLFGSGIWSPIHSELGGIDYIVWRLPVRFAYALFAFLGADSDFANRFLVFAPRAVLLPIAGYALGRHLTGSRLAGYAASFVLGYNTYYLSIDSQGHFLLPIAGANAIFALLAFLRALDGGKAPWAVGAGLLLATVAWADMRIAYLIVPVMVSYALFHALFVRRPRSWGALGTGFFYLALPILILVLGTVFWWATIARLGSFAEMPSLGRALFGDMFWSLEAAVALHHPFWSGGKIFWFTTHPVEWHQWWIPVAAILGIAFNWKRPKVLFFGFIAAVGILLAKQSDHPFPGIYPWLFEHVPGFSAFREATKFYFYIAIGYAVAIGGLVAAGEARLGRRSGPLAFAPYLLVVCISLPFAFNAAPVITGSLSGMYRAASVPEGYLRLRELVRADREFSRVLWVPSFSSFRILSPLHPHVSFRSLAPELKDLMLGTVDLEFPTAYQEVNDFFASPSAIDRLRESSIGYVVVREITPSYDLFSNIVNGPHQRLYTNILDRQPHLTRIDGDFGGLAVYRTANHRPHLYLAPASGDDPRPPKLTFTSRSTSRYDFKIAGLREPVTLVFTDRFHDGWRMRIGRFSLADRFFEGYFEPNERHRATPISTNSFLLDPEALAERVGGGVSVHEDGSVEVTGTIFFVPQRTYLMGIVISSSAILLAVGYLLFYAHRRHRIP